MKYVKYKRLKEIFRCQIIAFLAQFRLNINIDIVTFVLSISIYRYKCSIYSYRDRYRNIETYTQRYVVRNGEQCWASSARYAAAPAAQVLTGLQEEDRIG